MAYAVEFAEVLLLEGPGDLDGPVAAEIEEDHRIAVLDGADRTAVLGDDKAGHILVGHLRVFPVIGRNRLDGRGKLPP